MKTTDDNYKAACLTEMIHIDNVHHFNEIILWSMFGTVLPFLFMDVTSMPLQPVTGNFFLNIVNIILLYKLELLTKCYRQEAHKSNANNLLQLKKKQISHLELHTRYRHIYAHYHTYKYCIQCSPTSIILYNCQISQSAFVCKTITHKKLKLGNN